MYMGSRFRTVETTSFKQRRQVRRTIGASFSSWAPLRETLLITIFFLTGNRASHVLHKKYMTKLSQRLCNGLGRLLIAAGLVVSFGEATQGEKTFENTSRGRDAVCTLFNAEGTPFGKTGLFHQRHFPPDTAALRGAKKLKIDYEERRSYGLASLWTPEPCRERRKDEWKVRGEKKRRIGELWINFERLRLFNVCWHRTAHGRLSRFAPFETRPGFDPATLGSSVESRNHRATVTWDTTR